MSLIKVVDVRKQFQNHLALDDVSFEIEKGQVFGLLGPNGAGKTTFIRILNQITAPDSGYILFNDQKLTSEHIKDIGYLPEERGLYKKMKVGEQALYLARLKGMSKSGTIDELKKWFEHFEILSWWNKKIEELSKGMAQKVQFITTVIHKPNLLIFDEPFSGFDPVNVQMLKNEILRLRDEGATVIFSTHNMSSVEELCDSIVLLNNSKVVLTGKVDDVKEKFKENKFSFKINVKDDSINTDSLSNDLKIENLKREDNLISGIVTIDSTNQVLNDFKGHSNYMLNKLMEIGDVISFNEILPSMNDIFINTVTKLNKDE